MKLYLAGLYTSNFDLNGRLYSRLTDNEKLHRDNVQYILESYHYIHRDSYVKKIRKDGKKVFLDSGAFSAFTKGVKVDIKKYCRYIQENQDIIECASVLDAIGDPQGTYENQAEMERLGTRPLPCFHYGEDERYLEYYVANYDYITLGGMVPISTPQLKYWLDRLWEKYLTDGAGRPKIQVHGFGLTTLSLMERYPWYSVDSSSWVQIAANGNVILPDYGMVSISESSPARKQAGRHFDTTPAMQKEALAEKLMSPGFEIERLQKEYISRWTFNCWAFTEINKKYVEPDPKYTPDQIGLF
jgi:hypothetical protein